jgi:hypothetical protein
MPASKQGEAWLTKNKVNPFPIPGQLSIADGRLRFTVGAAASKSSIGWLEEALGQGDLKQRLEQGEEVTVFDLAQSETQVSFPKISGGAAAELTGGDRSWMVWFSFPGSSVLSLMKGRKAAKEWKPALEG